jgi:lipopolysaccharide assembly outer membrane protein LptD (OstA)
MGLPLAVFPNKGGNRQSGWIMPSFASHNSIGTGFRNFGYYWASSDYIDAKAILNFFDREGVHVHSSIKYKRRHGQRWYNYKLNSNLNATFKRRITTNEIMDLTEDFC